MIFEDDNDMLPNAAGDRLTKRLKEDPNEDTTTQPDGKQSTHTRPRGRRHRSKIAQPTGNGLLSLDAMDQGSFVHIANQQFALLTSPQKLSEMTSSTPKLKTKMMQRLKRREKPKIRSPGNQLPR